MDKNNCESDLAVLLQLLLWWNVVVSHSSLPSPRIRCALSLFLSLSLSFDLFRSLSLSFSFSLFLSLLKQEHVEKNVFKPWRRRLPPRKTTTVFARRSRRSTGRPPRRPARYQFWHAHTFLLIEPDKRETISSNTSWQAMWQGHNF